MCWVIAIIISRSRCITAAHKAAENGHGKVIQLLHNAGVDIKSLNNDDSLAYLARKNGHPEVIQALQEAGVDVTLQNLKTFT